MAVTYTWKIDSMMTIDASAQEPNYVVSASYTLEGEESGYTSEIQNTAFFEVGSETEFIPYSSLTEEIVLGWIKSQLGESAVENYEYCIADQIANKINPPVTPQQQALPWS